MQRYGRRNRPFYRIAAVDQRTRRDGACIEQLGWYDPIEKNAEKAIQINEDRIKYWLGVGAQPTETLRDFLAKRGMGDLKSWEAERARQRKVQAENKAKAEAAAGDKKDDKKKA
jgi:small subunit ribosomal protein S16